MDEEIKNPVVVLTVAGVKYQILPNTISLNEKERVIHETKLSIEQWAATQSELSMVVMWWLARRAEGERQLTWKQAKQQWPGMDEFEYDVLDLDGDSHQADHPE